MWYRQLWGDILLWYLYVKGALSHLEKRSILLKDNNTHQKKHGVDFI